MFEVDGAVEKYYCQNLCYFAKLFLDHKTLYFDVDPFFFYVLCTQDERGFHPVGFYSKEKYSDAGYNLACILTFPSSQRKGYGRFLISFSYELSKKEEKIGSPEKPLSDLGAVSYRSYWASTLLRVLRYYPQQSISIMELTKMTSIVTEDVVQTLNFLGLLQINKDGKYTIYAPPALIEKLLVKYPVGNLPVDPDHLHWAPLIVTDPKKDRWSIKFYS
jgi:histone acetyltransferase MYST1